MVTDKQVDPAAAALEAGEPQRCEVIVFHGSRNPDSTAYGPDEQCENDAAPGSRVCVVHAYVIDEPPVTAPTPPPWADLLPQNPALLVRSDGRLEVADDEHAHDQYVCRAVGHEDCVLRDGHPGPPALVREYWWGPPPYEDEPNYRYFEDPKD